jgi:hypothetical protein
MFPVAPVAPARPAHRFDRIHRRDRKHGDDLPGEMGALQGVTQSRKKKLDM